MRLTQEVREVPQLVFDALQLILHVPRLVATDLIKIVEVAQESVDIVCQDLLPRCLHELRRYDRSFCM